MMKVRCIKLVDFKGIEQERSPWLTLGKIYPVLSIFFDSDGRRLLRLIGDGANGVALFQWEAFEVVSPKIPASWVIDSGGKGWIELTPGPWTQSGFWERYYNEHSLEPAIFDKEVHKILESDS